MKKILVALAAIVVIGIALVISGVSPLSFGEIQYDTVTFENSTVYVTVKVSMVDHPGYVLPAEQWEEVGWGVRPDEPSVNPISPDCMLRPVVINENYTVWAGGCTAQTVGLVLDGQSSLDVVQDMLLEDGYSRKLCPISYIPGQAPQGAPCLP